MVLRAQSDLLFQAALLCERYVCFIARRGGQEIGDCVPFFDKDSVNQDIISKNIA